MIKITEQSTSTLTADEWLEMSRLLIKAGYAVIRSRGKQPDSTKWKNGLIIATPDEFPKLD